MDPTPAPQPRRYRLLLAATGVPLLVLLAVVGAASLRHTETQPPTGLLVATPTPEPTPSIFPSLIGADDLTLSAPQGFGPIAAPLTAPPPGLGIDVTVQDARPDLPARLPVWRLGAPTPALDPVALAARFGIHHAPTVLKPGLALWGEELQVDTAHFRVVWQPVAGTASPRLGGTPRDTGNALQLATRWLENAGLAPDPTEPVTVVQTSTGDSASFAEWRVTWERSAPGYTEWPIDTTVMHVSADGTVKQLELSRPPLRGGALYPLRPWQDAVRDAQAGRWFQVCCGPPATPPARPTAIAVNIPELTVTYAQVDTPQGAFAVPMYAFHPPDDDAPGLVPALAP